MRLPKRVRLNCNHSSLLEGILTSLCNGRDREAEETPSQGESECDTLKKLQINGIQEQILAKLKNNESSANPNKAVKEIKGKNAKPSGETAEGSEQVPSVSEEGSSSKMPEFDGELSEPDEGAANGMSRSEE